MGQGTICLAFLSLIGLGLWQSMAMASAVTNEEVRGTIQSLIFSYNQMDNKLERHEHRERALGDVMKKALQTLLKGQKSMEPLIGIFTRLDERVSQIETMLMTQEDKYNAQSEKFSQDVAHMFKWMRENDECFKHPPGMANTVAETTAAALSNKFVVQQEQINKQLLEEMRQLSANVAKLLDSSKQAAVDTQQGFDRMPKTNDLLTQIDSKLKQHVATVITTKVDNKEFETKLVQQLGTLSNDVAQLCGDPKAVPATGLNEQDKAYIQELNNETLNALATMKSEANDAQETVLTKVTERIQQTEANIRSDVEHLSKDVSSSVKLLNIFNDEISSIFSKLTDGFEALSKFNNVMMINSELVLDTQRKVEFGTLQIVQQVSQLVEQQLGDLTNLVNKRFNDANNTIIATQADTNRNISSMLDTALTLVWHRIDIMSKEVSDNNELLRLMQSGHDGYLNSTFSTMLSLSSKVEDTKAHMIDMDSNLNFLLGKLSLMSSEFANIKRGLAESLEELRNSFHTMSERMPTGSAANNIDKNKYLTDVNLLNKRHTERQ